jgi:ferredoxin-NADP reductase
MYRLALYYLAAIWLVAFVFSIFNILPYNPSSLILSIAFITAVSWITNAVFAKIYKTPTNVESIYITAFILALIITPFRPISDGLGYLMFIGFASIWAMASKYLLVIHKKHIFNPAALAVAFTAFIGHQSASWWIGNTSIMPFILLGGLLMIRKLRREDMAISFLIVALITIISTGLMRGTGIITILQKAFLQSPLFFFAFIMITEPLTTPPTKTLQILYGSLVGFLFAPAIHFGSLYSTPELALLTGNIFSYIVSPKQKLILALKEKLKTASGAYDFVFVPDQSISFQPGQYMEWTLGHDHPDSHGNRRYFTIASSPTEKEIRMGVKFYPEPSSFKKTLLEMSKGSTIIASQLSGEFVLPKDKEQKLVFIAGGIGITPFRSMIKYLLDQKEKRDIIIIYSNGTVEEVAYKNIFDQAQEKLKIKTVYALTKEKEMPQGWHGYPGRVTRQLIEQEVPDYMERKFYISGPHAMVTAFENTLREMGIPHQQLKTDFFPGFV